MTVKNFLLGISSVFTIGTASAGIVFDDVKAIEEIKDAGINIVNPKIVSDSKVISAVKSIIEKASMPAKDFSIYDVDRYYFVKVSLDKGKLVFALTKDLKLILVGDILTSKSQVNVFKVFYQNVVENSVMENMNTIVSLAEVLGDKDKAISLSMELEDGISKVFVIKDKKLDIKELIPRKKDTDSPDMIIFEHPDCPHCKEFDKKVLPHLKNYWSVYITEDKNKEVFKDIGLKGTPAIIIPKDNYLIVVYNPSLDQLNKLLKYLKGGK